MTTRASEAHSNAVKARAEASFKKEERLKDGAKAMSEYQANSRLVEEKTARLRALRLAKEAAEAAEAAEKEREPAKKLKSRAKSFAR